MNIFILSTNPERAARYMCDKHIVKMGLESAQLISFVHHSFGTITSKTNAVCKCVKSFLRHPCTIWLLNDSSGYDWHARYAKEIFREYSRRYGKIHSMQSRLDRMLEENPHGCMNVIDHMKSLAKAPQAMPEKYRVAGDPVKAYRQYYIHEKSRFAKWNHSDMPAWYREALLEKVNDRIQENIIS